MRSSMPVEISVSDGDIAYAERILLPLGETFDDERRAFIKNLETIDLQAVPGSGKTTALLAKLLILDRHLPFSNGAGILVISHTNAAIDEIRDRIGLHCASLFRYPNFVGTIQGFVDKFLAVPYFVNRYKKPPVRIDDEIHDQRFLKPPFNIHGFSSQESKNARRYLIANTKRIRWSLVDGKACLTDGYCGKAIDFKKPRGITNPQIYADWNGAEKAKVRDWIRKFKSQILEEGFLCYDDAYLLARVSMSRNPLVKPLLQQRFSNVFVDEMQDMEEHQYRLLEDIFFDGGASVSAYQRIGDKNQSIFDRKEVSATPFWIDRETVLQLNGSYRLSGIIAGVVEAFAVSPIRIEGRKRNADGSEIAIKPHFIVFSEATKGQVISGFASIIKTLIASGDIPSKLGSKYKAVAWATKLEVGKIRLPDYHPKYSKEEQRKRIDYSDLASYLANYSKEQRDLSAIERNIGNALLRILRIEGILDSVGAPYSKRTMIAFLKEYRGDYWQVYQEKVYRWCMETVGGKTAAVLADVRDHLPTFLSAFDAGIKNSREFIDGMLNSGTSEAPSSAGVPQNVVPYEGFEVEVATVHSVKGETHAATLYMETFYERGGGGNYESERLAGSIKGVAVKGDAHNLVKQSAKMVYVGFSRPTHLLCFAVHESRFAKFEAGIDLGIWNVMRL